MLGMTAEEGKHINTSWINLYNPSFGGFNLDTYEPSGDVLNINNALEGYRVYWDLSSPPKLSIQKTDYTAQIVKLWGFPTTTTGYAWSKNALGIARVNLNDNNIVCGYSLGADTENGIVKFNTNSATVVWRKTINTIYGDYPTIYDVEQDSSGNIYFAGLANIGAGLSLKQPYIAKLDSNGNFLWATAISNGGSGVNYMNLFLDSSNNVYVINKNDPATGSYQTSYLAKFNSSGTYQWSAAPYTGGFTYSQMTISGITDSSNNLWVGYASSVYGSITSNNFILTKYNSSGVVVSAVSYDFTSYPLTTQKSISSAIDNSGNMYFTWFATGPFVGPLVIVKFDSTGTLLWTRILTTTGITYNFGAKNISINNYSGTYKLNIAVDSGTTGTISDQKVYISLPLDGSKTGTYVVGSVSFVYSAITVTGTAYTTPANVKTFTSSSQTFSVATGSTSVTEYTVGAQTLTSIP